ncbi:MAG: hypothetical protein HYS07_02495 [Chlamydiae bacterium]|nr:hypothetical protein [Chlamydiota bacterium]MBI3276681.1 hypothetical protein [Chlamydiota bacterium]
MYPSIEQRIDAKSFICYPVWSGIPIRYYYLAKALVQSVVRTPQTVGSFVSIGEKPTISGVDIETGHSVEFEIPSKKVQVLEEDPRLYIFYHELKTMSLSEETIKKDLKGVIIASIGPCDPQVFQKIQEELLSMGEHVWVLLNPFLKGEVKDIRKNKFVTSAVYISNDPTIKMATLVSLKKKFDHFLTFYLLSSEIDQKKQ